MQPIPTSTSGTTQVTISSDETPKILVLRLKSRGDALKTEELELASQLESDVHALGRSFLGQSSMQESPEVKDLDNTLYYSMCSDDELDAEEAAFQYLDEKGKLQVVREGLSIVQDNIEIVQNHEHEAEEITNLQLVMRHVLNIAAEEGTTFFSAIVTAGVSLYVGGPVFGATTSLIAGNELLKMAYRYVQKGGASDHLLVIGNCLKKIKSNADLAEQSIHRAETSQEEVAKKLGEIESTLEEYTLKFKSAAREQRENITKAIDKLKQSRGALLAQSHCLTEAEFLMRKSMAILEEQSNQLGSLQTAEYKIENPEDLKKVIEQINLAIHDIKMSSDQAYNFQTKAMNYLLQAVDVKNDLISLHHDLISAFAKIEMLECEQSKNEVLLEVAHNTIGEVVQENAKVKQELETQKKISDDNKTKAQTAEDNLGKQMEKENWGETSTTYGGAIAGGAGATVGLLLAGPTAALALGGAAFVGLGTAGIRAVHRVRLAMRTDQLEKKKMELEGMQTSLEGGNFNKEGGVIVTAEYGYSQGSFFGTRTLKGAWNAAGYVANYAAGKEVMGERKSSHAGEVKCVIGNIPITFDFDKTTGPSLIGTYVPKYMDLSGSDVVNAAYRDYVDYGAISQIDQIKLSDILLAELKKGVVKPQMVLDLLDKLSQVEIGNEVIAMIRKDSPHMKELRAECDSMLDHS